MISIPLRSARYVAQEAESVQYQVAIISSARTRGVVCSPTILYFSKFRTSRHEPPWSCRRPTLCATSFSDAIRRPRQWRSPRASFHLNTAARINSALARRLNSRPAIPPRVLVANRIRAWSTQVGLIVRVPPRASRAIAFHRARGDGGRPSFRPARPRRR